MPRSLLFTGAAVGGDLSTADAERVDASGRWVVPGGDLDTARRRPAADRRAA